MRIIQGIMRSMLHGGHFEETRLDAKSFELLKKIQQELSVFEPVDDDEARVIWLEIPRGTAEEMKAWDQFRFGNSRDEEDLQSYQEYLDEFNREIEWVFLSTSTYKENSFLKISDRCYKYVVMTNRDLDRNNYCYDMTWFLSPLLEMVKERVAEIVKDPEAYYRHLVSDLPHRQRSGKIRSRDLNAILPERRLVVENREYCISVMKELIRREQLYKDAPKGAGEDYWKENNLPEPFNEMTIRRFCHYYRIADMLFRNDSDILRDRDIDSIEDDVEYYKTFGLHYGKLDGYDLDNVDDFKAFANDHYGELGLSRMNVGSTDFYVDGQWLVTFSISYSAYVDIGLKIALALYETGAPFIYYDAENTLHVLEETGWVRIEPWTFHDYLRSGDDEGAISIPFVEDCGADDEISLEQFRCIVKKAVWEKPTRLRIDKPVEYDDPICALVRDKLQFPTTLSKIRQVIETQYNTYLSVHTDLRGKGFRYVLRRDGKHAGLKVSKTSYRTFNEAMYALIMDFNNLQRSK